MTRHSFVLAALVAAFPCLSHAEAAERLTLLPSRCELTTRESRQRLILQELEGDEAGRQITDKLTWSSSDPQVATVVDGLVIPAHDGQTTITAKVGERNATAQVIVSGMSRPFEWSFRTHVEPMLAKLGCNSGACHGALAGKGGFKLSLRGYDPATDYFNFVKQDRGRRVELSDPGRSLVLAKPSGAIAHKGGIRFATNSLDYRILAEWLSAGAAPPRDDDPRVRQLEILPSRSIQHVGQTQQILVRARYSDGRTEDVTRSVKWSSADEAVCRVDDQGKASVIGPGEGAVVAWYASRLAIARVTVPYDNKTPAKNDIVDKRKPRNFIDEQVDKQLTRLNLPASPACTDAEFVRRAYVDTIGRPPEVDEVKAFLADGSATKRDALIESLLKRPEFADYWTYKWSDLLMLSGTRLRPAGAQDLLSMDPQASGRWGAVGPVRPGDRHGNRREHRRRPHQFLCTLPVSRRHDRKRLSGVPRPVHRLRQVPQPPAREMDQRPVLQHGKPICPGASKRLGRRGTLRRRPPHALRR